MVDASHWSRCALLYPLTSFRDVKSSLNRADIIVLTQWESHPEVLTTLRKYQGAAGIPQIFEASIVPTELIPLNSKHFLSLSDLKDSPVAALCGIANPERFIALLQNFGSHICFQKFFRDHHHYQTSDILEFSKKARMSNAEYVITTQKDAVKISPHLSSSDIPFYFVKIKIEVKEKELFLEKLREPLHSELKRVK